MVALCLARGARRSVPCPRRSAFGADRPVSLYAVAARYAAHDTVLAAMLSPAAGLGLYFLLNYLVYGRWNQYHIYQWDNWNQKLGLFTNTVRYHLDYMAQWWDSSPKSALALCLAAVLCL